MASMSNDRKHWASIECLDRMASSRCVIKSGAAFLETPHPKYAPQSSNLLIRSRAPWHISAEARIVLICAPGISPRIPFRVVPRVLFALGGTIAAPERVCRAAADGWLI
jgi:hypothetical protein